MTNTNLAEFITGRVDGKYAPGADGSSVITLPELLGMGKGGICGNYSGTVGKYDNLTNSLMSNFKANWVMMSVGVVGIPIVVKTAMKLIRKPVVLPANRMLKSVGLDVKV